MIVSIMVDLPMIIGKYGNPHWQHSKVFFTIIMLLDVNDNNNCFCPHNYFAFMRSAYLHPNVLLFVISLIIPRNGSRYLLLAPVICCKYRDKFSKPPIISSSM